MFPDTGEHGDGDEAVEHSILIIGKMSLMKLIGKQSIQVALDLISWMVLTTSQSSTG